MTPAQAIRSALPLLAGLIVGGVGATLFTESMPGAEGSPKERADKLERELKQAQTRLAALEAPDPNSGEPRVRKRPERTLSDGLRRIGEDIRAGRPVSPEDIFRASQPLMRDLAPIVDRMRLRAERQMIDQMSGEFARKYNLTPEQQSALKVWFSTKAEEDAKRWTEMVGRDGTRLVDLMRATQEIRPDAGIESFMETTLTGDKLAAFKSERLNERAQRVQREADTKVERLNSIVKLSDAQRDQVFGVMARNSRDYDPAMVLEGTAGQINAVPAGDRQAAVLAVLTPDQRVAYEDERRRRAETASKEMQEFGLTLPPEWDMLEDMDFR